MSRVFLDSPTNSTMFTTCCQVAICDDQDTCPRCKTEVNPKGARARWEYAYGPIRRGVMGYGPARPRRYAQEKKS